MSSSWVAEQQPLRARRGSCVLEYDGDDLVGNSRKQMHGQWEIRNGRIPSGPHSTELSQSHTLQPGYVIELLTSLPRQGRGCVAPNVEVSCSRKLQLQRVGVELQRRWPSL